MTIPACAGAIFRLQQGFDLNAPQPTTDFVASLVLDGERPFGRRASNRTITLPVLIIGLNRQNLAAAREVLEQLIDQDQWPMTWTRAQSGRRADGRISKMVGTGAARSGQRRNFRVG